MKLSMLKSLMDIMSEIIGHAKNKISMFGLLLVLSCYFINDSKELHLKMADSIFKKTRSVQWGQGQKSVTKKFLW